MSVRLPDHLDLVACSPKGIDKLRALILELAVHGKLVEQDPDDEPASELLKRIAAEKVLLVDGRKKMKAVSPVIQDDQPFKLPTRWEWTHLGEVVTDSGAGWSPSCETRTRQGDEWGVLKVSAVSWGEFRPEQNKALPSNLAPRPEHEVIAGDFLISRANTAELVARSVVVDDTPAHLMLSDKIVRLKLSTLADGHFINIVNACPQARDYYARVAGGTSASMKNVSREQVLSLVVPLPPLAEQHRIVAKVDELMALCDRLEAEQADAGIAHARLVETLLGTLAQSADAAELAANWQLLAAHFDTLFATDASLNALKQTILQLAVMGRLVPQDPKDEPAGELLKRIAKERARMEFEGSCKKLKQITPKGEAEQPFEVPAGWAWASLEVIARRITDGEHISPKKTQSGMMLLTAKHILENGVNLDDPQYVAFEDGVRFRERCGPTVGDVLICSRGTIGRCCVVTFDAVFCLMGSVILVRPANQLIPSYLNSFLKSEIGQRFIRGATKGMAVNALYLKDIKQCMVPFPPLAEQRRIVAKVDELMALCDRLKADLAESRGRQEQLAATLIESALAA